MSFMGINVFDCFGKKMQSSVSRPIFDRYTVPCPNVYLFKILVVATITSLIKGECRYYSSYKESAESFLKSGAQEDP